MDFVSKNLNFGKNNFDAISPSMKTQSTSDLQKIELNPQNDYKRYTVMSIYRRHILRYIAGSPSSPVKETFLPKQMCIQNVNQGPLFSP